MNKETLTIGQEVEVYSYYTKQRGYGRQSLYVELKRTDIPIKNKKSTPSIVLHPAGIRHWNAGRLSACLSIRKYKA